MCIFHSNLRLRIWSQPWKRPIISSFLHSKVQLVSQLDGKGEELGSLVCGIAKHYALITRTKSFQLFFIVQTLRNVWRLLLYCYQDAGCMLVLPPAIEGL